MNESIYYNVDELHRAIAADRQIRFHYFEYTAQRKRQYRREGQFYQVSPFALIWESENYYLLAYDAGSGILKHYRVDKMTDIALTGEPRQGRETFEAQDMSAYTRKVFGMFSGREARVQLRFENRPCPGPLGHRCHADPRRGGAFYRPGGCGGEPAVLRLGLRLWGRGADPLAPVGRGGLRGAHPEDRSTL